MYQSIQQDMKFKATRHSSTFSVGNHAMRRQHSFWINRRLAPANATQDERGHRFFEKTERKNRERETHIDLEDRRFGAFRGGGGACTRSMGLQKVLSCLCKPEDVLRSYDGASDAEPRNPWAAPLPPMASRRKESAANSARRPVQQTVSARVSLCEP